MLKPVELIIPNEPDRADVAKILVKAGYRVCVVSKAVGNAKKKALVIDKPEKEETAI